MILTQNSEIRTKFVPTEEVLFDEVAWEVGYGVRYGTAQKGLILLRPRHGKHWIAHAAAQKILRGIVTSSQILALPRDNAISQVEVVHSGPFQRALQVERGKLVLDSGMRHVRGSSYPVMAPQFELETREDEVRRPPPRGVARKVLGTRDGRVPDLTMSQLATHVGVSSVSSTSRQEEITPSGYQLEGSKLVLMSRAQSGRMTLYLVQEAVQKGFDLPGGGTEAGELPEQTLLREIKEEMKVVMAPGSFYYLGDSVSQGGEACCHVYLGLEKQFDQTTLDMGKYRRHSLSSPHPTDQPYLSRILDYVLSKCGTWLGAWWVANAHSMVELEWTVERHPSDPNIVRHAKDAYEQAQRIMQATTPSSPGVPVPASPPPVSPGQGMSASTAWAPPVSTFVRTPLSNSNPSPPSVAVIGRPPIPMSAKPPKLSDVVVELTPLQQEERIQRDPDYLFIVVGKYLMGYYVVNHDWPTSQETYKYFSKRLPNFHIQRGIQSLVLRSWITRTDVGGGHVKFSVPEAMQ